MVSAVNVVLTATYLFMLYYTIFWLMALLEGREEDNQRKCRKFPKVSVVVPAYNEELQIERSAESVLQLDYPKDRVELILVDDGSTDATHQKMLEIQQRHADRSVTVIHKPNGGKWTALNEGLQAATGSYFACLDADSFIREDGLKKLLPYFEEKDVAIVLPLLKVKSPKNFLQRVQWYEYIINMFYKKIIGMLNCIHVAPGPFSLYRIAALRKVGGFKQAHLTEDLEIVLRMQESHYKIVQTTDTEAYTLAPKSLKQLYRQRYRWFKGSILNAWDYRHMMFKKSYGDFGIFQLPIVLVSGLITLTVVSLIIYSSIINPVSGILHNFSQVHFDILPFLKNIDVSFQFLDINFFRLEIMGFLMALSAIVIFLAHSFTKENLLRYGVFSLLLFAFFFYITLSVVWMGVLKDVLLKRRQRW